MDTKHPCYGACCNCPRCNSKHQFELALLLQHALKFTLSISEPNLVYHNGFAFYEFFLTKKGIQKKKNGILIFLRIQNSNIKKNSKWRSILPSIWVLTGEMVDGAIKMFHLCYSYCPSHMTITPAMYWWR